MEMPSSFGGDKHELCLAVIKFKYVRICPSFDITHTTLANFFPGSFRKSIYYSARYIYVCILL